MKKEIQYPLMTESDNTNLKTYKLLLKQSGILDEDLYFSEDSAKLFHDFKELGGFKTDKDARKFVNEFFKIIIKYVLNLDMVYLLGFGRFYITKYINGKVITKLTTVEDIKFILSGNNTKTKFRLGNRKSFDE